MEKEYRITRKKFYGPNSLGYKELVMRQGYYINAKSEKEAEILSRRVYGFSSTEPLDIQLWRC